MAKKKNGTAVDILVKEEKEGITVTKPYPGIVLKFDEARHIYYANGEPVISVTGATGIVDKSQALLGWSSRLFREALAKKIEKGEPITMEDVVAASRAHIEKKREAAGIGHLVHEWVELYTLGKKPRMLEDDRAKNGVLGFLRWIGEHKVKFLEAEKHLYSKAHRYAGRMDALAKVNGEMAVVDYKTSSGIYSEMRYQTAGYQGAREEMHGKKKKLIECRWIARFDKETGEFEAVRLDDFEKDFAAFLGCLAVKRREKELGRNGR